MTLPPRCWISRIRSTGLATWRNDHLETAGLAPTMIRHSVRSTSAYGIRNGNPYMSVFTENLLEQSWVDDA